MRIGERHLIVRMRKEAPDARYHALEVVARSSEARPRPAMKEKAIMALAGLHAHAHRRRPERAAHALEVAAASLLRAHAIHGRTGRRAGAGARELLSNRVGHLHSVDSLHSDGFADFLIFKNVVLGTLLYERHGSHEIFSERVF